MRTHFHWSRVLPLVVVFTLALAAFSPTVAQAEGDVPETPLPLEPAAPQPEEPGETPVTAAVQVLAETGAELAGEDGAIPLASQSALTILCAPDPWFYCLNCPGGISPAYTTIAGAISNWVSLKGVGLLYLEGDHTYTESVDLDGTVTGFSTLKGIVWDNKSVDKPVIQGTISIHGFAGGFTLQGISILADSALEGLDIENNKGLLKLVDLAVTNTSGSGAYINHTGSVDMLRMDVSHNEYDGMHLLTCNLGDWQICPVSGTIKITDSTFSFNGNDTGLYAGLWLRTRNPVTINGFSAISNKGDGLDFEAFGGALTIKNAVFMNSTTDEEGNGFGLWVSTESFSNITLENVAATGNANDGLYIGTTGTVTLKNVTSYSNAKSGLRITGDMFDLMVPAARSVAITNSTFFGNPSDNLIIASLGPITLTNVNAYDSTNGNGAYLDNSSSLLPAPVTVTNGVFSNNGGAGLEVYSKGNITLNTITASINNSYGVYLDNNFAGATGGITMLAAYGVNTIQSNGHIVGDGLRINTTRNITINKLSVSGSSEDGINVETAGLTTNLLLTDVSIWENNGWGIEAEVGGTITWNRGGAWDNGQDSLQHCGGADLKNYFSGLPKNITLKDVVFDGNKGAEGLYLETLGSITLTNISASGNTGGAGIYFEAPIGEGGNFTILRTKPEGYNTINGNGLEGLYIYTRGNITLNRVQVNDNNTVNAYLDTCQEGISGCDGIGTVTIKGTPSFPVQFNGSRSDNGLFINASGNITLSGIQANQNYLHGMDVVSVNGSVSVVGTGNQFNKNGLAPLNTGGGAVITAKGSITLMNFLAEENDWKGVLLDNTSGTGNVTVTATVPYFVNRVYNNTDRGMEIFSNGIVLVSKVNVEENDKGGLLIKNETASLPKPVSVTSSTFKRNSNMFSGLEVKTKGAITLNMVTASNSWMYGANLDNTAWTTSAFPVSVTKSSFNDNLGTGLYVKATGPITLNSVSALKNNNPGVELDNSNSPVNSPITLIGTNNFSENTGSGLWIKSLGAVSISGVAAAHNQDRGIDINQAGTIMLVNSQVLHNINEGVYSTSVGNTTVRNLLAFLNGANDAVNYNPGMDIASLNGKIYLYSSSFIGNYGIGFEAYVNNTKLDFYMSQVNYMGNFGGTYAVYPNEP